jgi:hypothetical protein
MKLTAERFAQIIGALRSDAKCGRDSERRRNPRVGLRAQVLIAIRDKEGVVNRTVTWTRDVSVGGIGLMLSKPVAMGTYFLAHLEGRDGSTDVLYQVVRCYPGPSKDIFHVGARFERYVTSRPKN